jgi:8-oxo-dGTP diphosphatase
MMASALQHPTEKMKRESHLGVYAMIEAGGKLALIMKGRGPYTGSWDLPGGRIEFGESPMDALVREVREETGLRVSSARLVDTLSVVVCFENASGEPVELHHLGIIFACDVQASHELRAGGDNEDAREARWIPLAEAGRLDLTPFARIGTGKSGAGDGQINSIPDKSLNIHFK